jgi:hypothetical protein
MADLYKVETSRRPARAGSNGKVQREPFFNQAGKRELAAAALNDVIHVCQVPAFSRVDDIFVKYDALGATNGVTLKLVKKSDGTDLVTLKTAADVSSAGSARGLDVDLYTLEEDAYLVALKTGAGTATGTIGGFIDYEYIGND